jgi:hypothetical protein
MAAPVGSVSTSIVPISPTAMVGTTMVPPSAVTASAVAAASSVARYTDQPSGTPWAGSLAMPPATMVPSL